MSSVDGINAFQFFADYLQITGVAHTDPEPEGEPALIGKRLGLLNGASWIGMWATYFGRKFVPGAHLVNVGNEAVQINFMQAHAAGEPTPPQSNIETFARYARDLVELAQVDAILITCSTMNRSYPQVQAAVEEYSVPVIQIDRPMMEAAVNVGGKVLVVATHGPTVNATQTLLQETANEMGPALAFSGVTEEEAWHRLAVGDVAGHNDLIAAAIRGKLTTEPDIKSVVLAQLSMTLFVLSYPDPETTFGVPVFTSGQCGFEAIRRLLTQTGD